MSLIFNQEHGKETKNVFYFSWEVGDWTSCDLHCSGVRSRPVRCTLSIREKRILVRNFTLHFYVVCKYLLKATDPSGLAFPDSKWRQLYSRCLLNWWGVKNSGLFIGLGIQMTFLVFFYVYGFTNGTLLPKYLSLVLLTKTWMNHQRERYWKKLQAQYQSQTYLMDLSGMIDVRLQDTIPWVSIFPGELL